jgi:hypothetical protein
MKKNAKETEKQAQKEVNSIMFLLSYTFPQLLFGVEIHQGAEARAKTFFLFFCKPNQTRRKAKERNEGKIVMFSILIASPTVAHLLVVVIFLMIYNTLNYE